MKNGFCLASRQQAKASRLRGFMPRRRLAKDFAGSAKNMTPNRETTRSAAWFVRSWTVASASSSVIGRSFGARSRARVSIGSETSSSSTAPFAPTRSAKSIVVAPQPQPTSITRSPGFGCAAAISRSETGRSTLILMLLVVCPFPARIRVPVFGLRSVSGMNGGHGRLPRRVSYEALK